MTNCPQCQVPIDSESDVCSHCGVVFSKWKERENNVATGNLSKYDSFATATSSEFNWTILVIVTAAVAGLIYYLAQNAQEVLKDI